VKIASCPRLVLLLLLSGCGQPTVTNPATPVRVVAAINLADDIGLKYSAQVVPETQVELAFRTDGYVADITRVKSSAAPDRILQPGDVVKRGDVLARVDDAQYRDQVTKAQANLDKSLAALLKAELDYKRAKALHETQSITGPDFDAARKEYETAAAAVDGTRAQLDEARIKLQETALIAPMDATILSRAIEVGSLVHAGTVGFELANTRQVKVVFGIPDVVLKDVKLGSALDIRTASLPERVFSGTVTEIAPAAESRTRVFEVSVTLENGDGALRPGMVASLDVDTASLPDKVVVVPLSAIVSEPPNGFAVFVVSQSNGATVAQQRTVEAGDVLGNRIAISSGLEAGEQVVVTGTAQVRNGLPVRIVP
jgi:RND family efflux transporter MFP subunit